MAEPHPCSFPNVDVSNPDFPRRCLLWARRQQGEVAELIAGTIVTLASSRALLAEADRLLELK